MAGAMIEFPLTGNSGTGYLSPSESGSGPGVIVLQEWWGLVSHIKSVCDRFANAGFTALAPDLYDGDSTTEPDEAGSLMMALNIEKTARLLSAAIDALLSQDSVIGNQVGVVGFCMGGQLSLFASTLHAQIGACVDFYGIHPSVEPDYSKVRCPILGLFAENDPYASPEAVSELRRTLTQENIRFEFHTYPGVEHAFFNDDRPEVYDAKAAEDAWNRTIQFLRANLA